MTKTKKQKQPLCPGCAKKARAKSNKRTRILNLKVTPEELAAIKEHASWAEQSLSAYVRAALKI